MKVTQENPQAFKPVTITLKTRDELYAVWNVLANYHFDTDSTYDTIACSLYEDIDAILNH